MRSQSAMKLHVLFAVSFTWALREAPPPKYEHRDLANSAAHLCDQCPPGTAVHRHCSSDMPTVCAPCPDRQFAEQWHWGDACQHCTSVCKERQVVRQECNSTHDQLCQCVQGYHLEVEFCVRHAACPPGHGVTLLGTPESDTVCEQCPTGYFSSVTSTTEPCSPHRNCNEMGLRTVLPGTATHDATCESDGRGSDSDCLHQQPQCGTAVTLCEEAIFQFLASAQLTSSQLNALMENLPGKKVDRKSVERVKMTCKPEQWAIKVLRLWREQNKDQDKILSIIREVNHCERMVSRCVGLKNLTLSDLTVVMDSLPGVRVPEEDVREVVTSCQSSQYILRLLHLWRTQNGEQDVAKGVATSLRRLRAQGVTHHNLLKSIRRIGKIFSTSFLHKMYEKMFFDMIQDSKFMNSKSHND